jgi:hypothetical protein
MRSVYSSRSLVIGNVITALTPEERAKVELEKAPSETPIEINAPRKVTIAPRVKEMLTFAREKGAMRVGDLIKLGHELLDDLGIER